MGDNVKKFVFGLILGAISFLSSSVLVETNNFLFFSPQMISYHLKDYRDNEKIEIAKDLSFVRSVCFSNYKNCTKEKPVYLASAGAPGARKTTILERFIQEKLPLSSYIYLDPDQRGLKFMSHTYYASSLSAFVNAQNQNYLDTIKNGYDKWRAASNYITLTLLEEALSKKMDIVYGTTSTGPHVPEFFSKLKEANYEIVLLLCSCEDSLREKAIQYRNQEQRFYQSTPKDAVEKGKFFSERMGAYFQWGDKLYLYWSDDLFSKERLAAVLENGKITILDQGAYENFVKKYEKDISLEEVKLPSWNEFLDIYKNRF
jgi:hypothetical protein